MGMAGIDPSSNMLSFEEAKKDIVADLKNLQKSAPDFLFTVGEKSYTATEMLAEVEQETEFGNGHVYDYIFGKKFLAKK